MKKFVLGLLAGFLLAGLAGVILVFALMRLGDRKPSIPDRAALTLRLEGAMPERAPVDIPLPFFESASPMTVVEFWDLMRRAERDDRIKAIWLEPRSLAVGWAKLQEMHAALTNFKRSGKPLVAYLRNPGAREFYLATAAGNIYMAREDLLDLKGLRAEFLFFRKALDRFGVEFEVERAGKYKDAADAFTRTSLSPESREAMGGVLDQIYGDLVRRIAEGRKLEPGVVRSLIDEGPFLARRAEESRLVTALLFEDEAMNALREQAGDKTLSRLSHRDYLRIARASWATGGRQRVALIVGEGTILRGGAGQWGDDSALWSRTFSRLLDQVAEDDTLKGAILRIDSPGGDAIASDEILHAARRLGKKKPLVISMSDVAASGGYYIAMTGDPVVAWPNTITGSIGVIYGKLHLGRLYGKIGIDTELLTRGRNAAIDTDTRPLTAAGREKLREGIAATYDSFLDRVAEGRNRPKEEIEPLAQGRVWMGSDAREHGLVDHLGGLDRALELLREKAGIAADERLSIIVYPSRTTILDQIFSRSTEAAVADDTIFGRRFDTEIRNALGGVDLRLLRQGGLMRLAPYAIRVR